MGDDVKFEMIEIISEGKNFTVIVQPYYDDNVENSTAEFDQSALVTKADNEESMEISPGLEEKGEDKKQGLFAPFNHHMRPDLEYIRLESEQSASNQEAATKLINDRYKLIMENAARRKEKEQEDRKKFIRVPDNVNNEKVVRINQLSNYVDIENIEKTTELLDNLNLAPSSPTNDQSEEFSDSHFEKVYWHSGLNRFVKLDYVEINTKADISSIDMLNTVTDHHELRVEDTLRNIKNEQKEGEKRITFSQVSRKLGTAKPKTATQIVCDENEVIGSSFEELLTRRYESLYEI